MPLSAFGQWVNSTRETILTDPKFILNEISRQAYTLAFLLDQSNPFRNVRAGTFITERVKVINAGTYSAYNPGQPRSPTRTNPLRSLRFDWTFGESHVLYTDAEIELNGGEDMYVKYKDFREGLRQDGLTDHIEGVENALWAVPNLTLMQDVTGTDARVPFSIPVFISEDSTRFRPPSGVWNSNNIAGMDVTAVTAWRNQIERYDSLNKSDPNSGIIAAFDRMMTLLNFRPLAKAGNTMQFTSMSDITIFTNRDGLANVQSLYRNAQDAFISKQDAAYPGPTHYGRPIVYVTALDTAALEPNLNDNATAYTGAYTVGKPRYFFVNKKHLSPVWHPKNFMDEKEAISGGIVGRDTEAIFYVSWWLTACNSRRRQGIVAPQ